ncbi:holo-ACP synthase [uncultured Cellulomonas sp.]|uniref:holo-ACP synthase n=1 Tax=uncultured Cellulomonas sp. TaxID=189682 RepID=UPI00261E7405|nr:holo-ACP synthase [uncultured Cellulomonas sp.]
MDLVDCSRIERMLQEDDGFLAIAFTAYEQEECGVDAARLGGRWAAKEAAMKALGRGIGSIAPQDVEIQSDSEGGPTLRLTGSAQRRAQELGATSWDVSLSHESGFAVAFVIMTIGGPCV